jgi:triphosphatase
LTIRVRKEGRRYIQTLKADSVQGVASFERPEWEALLSGPAPDLSQDNMRKHLRGIDGSQLQPVFTTRIWRSTRLLHPSANTAVEVSFDRGTIETPAGAALPVCEIELELKEGKPDALFHVARSLTHARLLRIEPRSKAARGYSLLQGPEGPSVSTRQRYGQIDLERDMPVEDAMAAIVRCCLEHMIINDRAVLDGDAEGVHQMRVALRRLRASLSSFRALIPADQRTHAVQELKWLAGALGTARNWDVFASLLQPVEHAFPADRDLKALSGAVNKQQQAAYSAMRDILMSRRYTEIALDLMTWVETRAWRHQEISDTAIILLSPLGDLADELLEKHYRQVCKLAKKFDELDAERRHEFRIALKKQRYAADSFGSIYRAKPVSRYLKRLSALQNDLGLLNDIATADKLIHELLQPMQAYEDLRRAAALLRRWMRRMAIENEAKLNKNVVLLLKAKRFWRRPSKDIKLH